MNSILNNNARRTFSLAFLVLLASVSSGCASWTNPVANGIPVRMLPEELLVEPKEELEEIPWGLLQRTPPEKLVIQPEDVLGVYIVGILGNENQLPPVQVPDSANVPPSLGFPIPVREDGTIPLPLIDDPKVAGLTIQQAEQKVQRAYTKAKRILQPDQPIILTMIRPKTIRVLVVRQDSLGSRGQQFIQTGRGLLANQLTATNSTRRGAGFELQVPAVEADVLSALAGTGGLPGLDAEHEVLIYRSKKGQKRVDLQDLDRVRLSEPQRIPLKFKKGEKPQISEQDVTLYENDIVVLSVRDPEYYYTAGLMPNREQPLPLDYDITATEAVTRGGGPLLNGGFGGANFNGFILAGGLGGPSPSLLTVLRKAPNGQMVPIRVDLNEAMRDPRENILIKHGDMLVLQETSGEAFGRYLSGILDFSGTAAVNNTNGFTTRSRTATGALTIP